MSDQKTREMMWDYLEEETDALLLEMRERVEKDGFSKALKNRIDGETDLLFNMTVMLHVKAMVMMCEAAGHPSPAIALKEISIPQQLRMANYFTLKMWEKQARGRKK